MIFLKAGSSLLASGRKLVLPAWSRNVHHEIELGLILGSDLQPEKAVVTLDLTARDIQAGLKQRQWPWSLAKTFPHSTPVGSVFGINGMDLQKLELLLQVNGKLRQQSSTEHMIFPIAELVQYIKDRFPVVPGDLILTGTPEGVSAIQHGDHVVAQVFSEGRKTLLSEGSWEVVQG